MTARSARRDEGGAGLDSIDRQIIVATQAGLPLSPRPFDDLAAALGLDVSQVTARMNAMLARGVIRRIAAVPNHYRLGYRANGMSVWDVDDDQVSSLGRKVGALPFVSHCYRRPRRPPDWPYNLFAMVHARDSSEVEAKVAQIARLLAPYAWAHEVLYSTRILKKTGLRLAPEDHQIGQE